MRIEFVKMHGLGNDFVVLDARTTSLPELTGHSVRRIADRREGVGCDQLIVLEPPRSREAELRMRIFNADGGEVESCGNASRAVAMLLGKPARVETGGGTIAVEPRSGGASVDMGTPRFEWDAVPLAYAMDTLTMPVAWDRLDNPSALRMGNPHVVFFTADCDAVPLEALGPQIEADPLFPERVNVSVATVEDRGRIRLRTWERGAGLTRACGTAACATAVAANRRGLAGRKVAILPPGGELEIVWGEDGRVTMSGAAAESFRGSFVWEDYA